MSGRASGPAFTVTDEWRQAIIDRVAAMGITRGELATRCGVGESTLSEALTFTAKGGNESPRIVTQIHEALGLPPPHRLDAHDVDGTAAEVRRLLLGLSSDQLRGFLEFIRKPVA